MVGRSSRKGLAAWRAGYQARAGGKTGRPVPPDGLVQDCCLVAVERSPQGLGTATTAGVFPVHLNQPLGAIRKFLVVASVPEAASSEQGTPLPRALVRVLIT